MTGVTIKMWGVFPVNGEWGVFKFNLKNPTITFPSREEARNWAMAQADPGDFSVVRIGNEDGSKLLDWVPILAGKPWSPEDQLRAEETLTKVKFLVEKDLEEAPDA